MFSGLGAPVVEQFSIPVDLSSGRRQGADAVRAKVDRRLAAVEQVAADAGAAAAAGPALAKVRRLVPGLVAAVAFFWARAEAAAAAQFGERSWRWAERLICGHYLRRAASRVKGAPRRRQLRELADRCLAAARQKAG